MIGGAFRYNAENVRYSATPWLTGDGSTSSGTLLDRHGNPISSGKLERVNAIHRTDWQGRQLLYATERTNLALNSILAGAGSVPTSWVQTTGTGTSAYATSIYGSPDGSRAYLQSVTSGGRQVIDQSQTLAINTTYTFSALVESITTGLPLNNLLGLSALPPGASVSYTVNDVPQVGSYLITGPCKVALIMAVAATGAAIRFRIGVGAANALTPAMSMQFSRPQFETGSVATARIPTTTAAVTVTDYTLTGPSVALGQVPVVGAVLDWDGVAKR